MFPGLFRKGPKRASKVEEQKLIEVAKKIKENPKVVIPKCESSCFLCKFGKEKRLVEKLENYKEDQKKLEKYSKRGPDLTKATAATMLLAYEGKAKLLANAKTPQGNISYAKKGSAKAGCLVGIQHFDDPFLRLMAYHDYSKKGYHIYSWGGELVCTGKEDAPPKGYIKRKIFTSGYKFNKEKQGYSCSHTDHGLTYFTLKWRSINRSFKVCERCADDGSNLFIHFSSGIASPDNQKLFAVEGKYLMKCGSNCESCRIADNTYSLKRSTKNEYFSGSMSDRTLIDRIVSENRNALKKNSELYAISEKCFGDDARAFLNSLRYEDWEEDVLKKTIKLTGPVMLEHGTVNELLEKAWDENAVEILSVMLDDESIVGELVSAGKKKGEIPREVVRTARKKKMKLDELSSLPSFKSLPPRAKFAHDLILAFKTSGADEALNYVKEINPRDTRMKAIAYGFLHAIGRAQSHKWKYDDNEVETGEFLSGYFEALFEKSGKDYAQSLQELLKMSGSTETIVLENGTKMR
ncbi:MAG: hypothetical protein R6U17_09855 [Thermoplasmata archaeon]